MKKELALHLTSTLVFFALITLFNKLFSFSFWPMWLGGLVGTFLPDIDHLIYVYFLEPNDLNSQRFNYLRKEGNPIKALDILAESRYERTKLVLHTAIFSLIFLVVTFLVVTSSGSLFAKGIVIAFYLHLLVDQFVDLMKLESLSSWFKQLNIILDKKQSLTFWLLQSAVFIIIVFIL